METVDRLQVLLVLSSMFFGIMPKNGLTANRSFGNWMLRGDGERTPQLKVEKLKFIVNYFNVAI